MSSVAAAVKFAGSNETPSQKARGAPRPPNSSRRKRDNALTPSIGVHSLLEPCIGELTLSACAHLVCASTAGSSPCNPISIDEATRRNLRIRIPTGHERTSVDVSHEKPSTPSDDGNGMLLDSGDFASIARDIDIQDDIELNETAWDVASSGGCGTRTPDLSRPSASAVPEPVLHHNYSHDKRTPHLGRMPDMTPPARTPIPPRPPSCCGDATQRQPRSVSGWSTASTPAPIQTPEQLRSCSGINTCQHQQPSPSSATAQLALNPQGMSMMQPMAMGGIGLTYGSMITHDLQSALVRAELARVTQERVENERVARDARVREAQYRAYYGFPF